MSESLDCIYLYGVYSRLAGMKWLADKNFSRQINKARVTIAKIKKEVYIASTCTIYILGLAEPTLKNNKLVNFQYFLSCEGYDDDDDFLLQKASLVGSLMRAESYII